MRVRPGGGSGGSGDALAPCQRDQRAAFRMRTQHMLICSLTHRSLKPINQHNQPITFATHHYLDHQRLIHVCISKHLGT